jgi:glycosyltransferase involved in cell wall biosynthesis
MSSKLVANNSQSCIGIVVIGRNEGERLRRCLDSTVAAGRHIVYVDSGSTDGSLALAMAKGAVVLPLDMTTPFCAARARNEGYRQLTQLDDGLRYVQFVDADCELDANWLPQALAALEKRTDVAAVAGWLRERAPEASIYNRIAELEWNQSSPGPVDAVGGIFLIRRDAFDSVEGFNATIPAGEEPELCQRLIHKGWKLLRLDYEMARHDLAMMRFSQWWRRMGRAGYGSMDVAYRFGVGRFSNNVWRVLGWSGWMATTVIAALVAIITQSTALAALAIAMFAIWPVRVIRIALRTRAKGHPWSVALPYAFLMAICFLPQGWGQLRYLADRLLNRSLRLLEYKSG